MGKRKGLKVHAWDGGDRQFNAEHGALSIRPWIRLHT